jgi:SAM-dependent methyltransferase
LNQNLETFQYKGKEYPDYIRRGNAVSFIIPFAQQYCIGNGLDIGGTAEWKLPGSKPINTIFHDGSDAYEIESLTSGYDFIFSSHCLEHLPDYVKALEFWISLLRPGGSLFLYLPHPEMRYWNPQHCRKHLHLFHPKDMEQLFIDLGLKKVFYGERDLYWSFPIVGEKFE